MAILLHDKVPQFFSDYEEMSVLIPRMLWIFLENDFHRLPQKPAAIRQSRFPLRASAAALFSSSLLLAGCGGGSGGSNPVTPPVTPTPDMGTLSTVNDSYQYKLKNAASSLVLGLTGQSQVAGTNAAQESDTGTTDALWHFLPMPNTQYNVENLLTHQVLGIAAASTAAGAQALQWADNGTNDHLWSFYLLKDGNYLIQNVNSGYYLEDANSGATSSAIIDQGVRATTGTGCTCQEWALESTGKSPYTAPMTVSGTGIFVHDPYMLQDPATHTYWLYGTHQTIAYSTDMVDFTYTTAATPEGACTAAQGTAWLTQDARCPIIGPDFASWNGLQTPKSDNNGNNTDIWAPDLMYANGLFYQYYSVPYEPGTSGAAEAVIGLATSPNAWGPWTDKGWVVSSWSGSATPPAGFGFTAGSTFNAIDPAPFTDAAGNWWLSFGSFFDGIHLIQLDPATGMPLSRDPATYPVIAHRDAGEEGSFVYPWTVNGTLYYYYFAPINVCCEGDSSTYRIIYGRSTLPTGPYLDRGGLDLKDGGGTILLSAHDHINGPGGQSVFTDTGADGSKSLPTLVYHYYDGNNGGTPTLGLNRLAFTSDGWPYIP